MHGHRRIKLIRGALFQLVLVGVAAILYFVVRGFTQGDSDTAIANAHTVLRWEHFLRLDVETGMQDLVLPRRALITIANWVYMWGHWPVIGPALLALYVKDRTHYVLLRNAMFLSGAVGLVIFATWPVAPPRLLPGMGYVDTVTVWSDSYRVLQPPALVNKYAAMPSFHVGWNVLVGIMMWKTFRRAWTRVFAVAGPVLMAAAVIATANHFVLDSIVGVGIALAALAASYRLYGFTYRRGLDLARIRLLPDEQSKAHDGTRSPIYRQAEAS